MKFNGAVLAILFIAFQVSGQIPPAAKEAYFKDWNYGPTGVFGLGKLEKPTARSYYRIWKPDLTDVRVQSINASGIVTTTAAIHFVGGRLNTVAWTDRWADTYQITKFIPAGPGQFYVTTMNTGENSFFPAKRAKYTYINNLLAEVRYYSYDDRLTTLGSGVAIVRYKRFADRNRYSLLKEIAYFDEDDTPVISKNDDYHKVVYDRDERGNATAVSYYGVNSEPLTNRFGGFKSRSQFDENDRLVRSDVIGINDTILRNAYGVASSLYEYTNGLTTKTTRLDEKGNITKAADAGDGIAEIRYEYDDQGNNVATTYFDEKGAPMNNHSGVQRIVSSYASNGILNSVAYFDKSGSAVADSSGIHRYNYVRDDKGRVAQKSFYDVNDKPVKDDFDEVYMIKYKYDELGRTISTSYWQDANTRMNRWDGYHEGVSRYDADGRKIEETRYDTNGKLAVSKSGFSRVVLLYGKIGKVSERKFFNGEVPATVVESLSTGFHSIRTEYDGNGRVSSLTYFDIAGRPVNASFFLEDTPLVYQKVEFIYKGNRIVEERLYEANSRVAGKIINALQSDYIDLSGLARAHKNK